MRAADWDLASDALPERVLALLPDAVYENQFGTVAVRRDGEVFEVTTFRSDHDYADFRRPHRVEFGDTIELDLARRDFTCNAMAWGARAEAADTPGLVDPYAGLADIGARVLRAVGDPLLRFEEDALRMVRAVRLAATLEFGVEAATLAGIREQAELVSHLSGERIATELEKLLAAERPSIGLRLLGDTGLLAGISPELASQRGIPQNKVAGRGPVGPHPAIGRCRAGRPAGRPARRARPRHRQAGDLRRRPLHRARHGRGGPRRGVPGAAALAAGRSASASSTSSAITCSATSRTGPTRAVRRFIAKMTLDGTASEALEELFDLRAADNVGSGLPAEAGGLDELRARVAAALLEGVVLDRRDLAIDGRDLMTELGLGPGPRLGRILDALLDRVQSDPALNDGPTLLLLAQGMLGDDT